MASDSKRIGLTAGSWDMVHAGHVLHFAACKNHCDYLIVALQVDPSVREGKNKPIMSVLERTLILRSNKDVDEVIVYNTEEELHMLDGHLLIDVRFMGEDHKGEEHHETARVIYTTRRHDYSSTNIRKRLCEHL